MKLGVNLTKISQIEQFVSFYRDGKIDFVEILIDNFFHLDPEFLGDQLKSLPRSFHIMSSNYLDRTNEELETFSTKVKLFKDVLEPFYISDHLFKRKENGIIYPMQIECDYQTDEQLILSKIDYWQSLVNSTLYIENFPSIFLFENQINFFEKLILKEKVNILFDFSNAVISSLNTKISFEQWDKLIKAASHFHISGYRKSKEAKIYLDTHDTRISRLSKEWLWKYKKYLSSNQASLVVEYDSGINYDDWIKDIDSLRQLLS